ncbi:MAG: hypothetical protein KDE15_13535 [Erythrobacter sp.]|nr:hypothetical protein [Erythrobacter sp.]
MDLELPMIFAFVLTLVMVGVAFALTVHRRVVQHEERKLELKARIEEAKAQQVRTERQADSLLEDRVRVLERIATDSGSNIAAQIESLRDSQPLLREPAQ